MNAPLSARRGEGDEDKSSDYSNGGRERDSYDSGGRHTSLPQVIPRTNQARHNSQRPA